MLSRGWVTPSSLQEEASNEEQLSQISPERSGVWKLAENANYTITMSTIELAGTMHVCPCPVITTTLTTPLASKIPGGLSQWVAKVVIWAFPLHTGAKHDSAYCKFTTNLPNL